MKLAALVPVFGPLVALAKVVATVTILPDGAAVLYTTHVAPLNLEWVAGRARC